MAVDTILHDHSLHAELLRATPPVGVGTLTLLGYNLSDFALIITIIYTSCLLFVLIRDKFVAYYKRKDDNYIEED